MFFRSNDDLRREILGSIGCCPSCSASSSASGGGGAADDSSRLKVHGLSSIWISTVVDASFPMTSFSAAFDADFGAPPPAPPADREGCEAEGVSRGPSDDFGDFEGAEGNDFGDFEGAAPAESGEPAATPRRGSVPFSAELD